MNKYFLLLISVMLIGIIANAQQQKPTGNITGIVLDAETKKPFEFCTVSLLKQTDSTIVNGALTNEVGAFIFENIANGNYIIKASFVGFQNGFANNIAIDNDNNTLKLRPIFMKLKVMKTIEVTADKSTLQLEPDKKVFNVEKSIISQGGTAADVLKNVPTINVDADGNMNMRGSDNITIYIDGRQSAQLSNNPSQALQQLPAGMIEKVEIITNPSSKYEASGSTGIINIVTKKNGQQGFNGSISAGFGDNDKFNKINKFNNSVLLNYQKNKINVFANYSYRYDTRTGYGILDLEDLINTNYPKLYQNSTSLNLNRTHSVKAGIDYTISKTLSAGVSASRNFGIQNSDENNIYFNQKVGGDTLSKRKRESSALNNSKNFDAAFFITKKFKKPSHSLSFDANISDNINLQNTDYSDYNYNLIEKYYFSNPTLVNVSQPTHNTTFNAQTDYSNSINKVKLESGLRYTNRIIDNTFLQDTLNVNEAKLKQNDFVYNDIVAAAYLSASTEIGGYKLKSGVRAENTDYSFNQKTLGTKTNKSYLSVFPTASIGKKLKHNVDFSMSYSKRINRPSTNNLNPLPDITNPTNIMVGNPNLKPVYLHALEASFSKYFGPQFVLATAYIRRQVNTIQRYVTYDSVAFISTVSFKNLNNSTNYGLELVTKNQLTNKYDITTNINLFEQQLNGENIMPGLSNRNFAATFRLIFNAKLPKNFSLQLSGNYNTPSRSILGSIKSLGFAEVGVRKDFLNHKLTTSISLNDIFDTQRFRISIAGNGFERHMVRKRETRIIQFSLSYRFGQADTKKTKQQQENKERDNGAMDVF